MNFSGVVVVVVPDKVEWASLKIKVEDMDEYDNANDTD